MKVPQYHVGKGLGAGRKARHAAPLPYVAPQGEAKYRSRNDRARWYRWQAGALKPGRTGPVTGRFTLKRH